MKYTVVWTQEAEAELATAWVDAPSSALRNEITANVAAIEGALRTQPGETGESREGTVRMAVVGPVGIVFRVLEDDCLVQVVSLRVRDW
jgi:hypothetical protein